MHDLPPDLGGFQPAIGLQRRYPETVAAIGKPLGGEGTGAQASLAQYLANEFSKQIKAQGRGHPVEGAFFSGADIDRISLRDAGGNVFVFSLTGSDNDLSMYRLR